MRQRQVGSVDADAIAQWTCDSYPRRQYPAVLIGSSSGAAEHLAALAGVPWLPQTFLVWCHRALDPDDSRSAMDALADARAAFTEKNPGTAVRHMHDANQDRLMIRRMGYFRFKYQQLPATYETFLRENLAPGGTVVVMDCGERWPPPGPGRGRSSSTARSATRHRTSTRTAASGWPSSSPSRAPTAWHGIRRPPTARARRRSGIRRRVAA